MRGKICVSRWARSTRDAASCCHPVVQVQSPLAGQVEDARRSSQLSMLAQCRLLPEGRASRVPLKLFRQLGCTVEVASVCHCEAICTARPMCSNSGAPCTAEPEPTKTQWESGCIFHFDRTLAQVQLKDVLQASSQNFVVISCKSLYHCLRALREQHARAEAQWTRSNHALWTSLMEDISSSMTSDSSRAATKS